MPDATLTAKAGRVAEAPSARASTLIESLAGFAHGLDLAAVPAEVRRQAAACILDTIGCIIAGWHAPEVQALLRAEREGAAAGTASVLGASLKLSPESAARLNGYLGDVFELNDLIGGHASIGTVTAMLALVQQRRSSGSDLLRAVIAGLESTARVYSAFYPAIRPYTAVGLTPVGLPSSFGAAAGVALLLGLDEGQVADAIAISGALGGWCPSEVIFGDGGTVKAMLFGALPAATAITAARYAAHGMTGPRELLEGSRGYFRTVADRFDPKEVTVPGRWHLARPRRKQHACCGYIHAALDLMAEQRRAIGTDRLRGATITIEMPQYVLPAVSKNAPPISANEARFHTQFCVAVVAAGDDVILPEHSIRAAFYLADPAVAAFLHSVKIEPDEALRHYEECRLTAVLADGTRHQAFTRSAKGAPGNPMTPDDVVGKFLMLTRSRMPEDRAVGYARRILGIEGERRLDWVFDELDLT
ncbi:2-methylcitrate dehydratase PrpD [Humitalea rosea]|uniref:2-methylcitrate dehydratase PrpD n=1 Tax=Humitalea rosea TaxID=990373 RepID=A0A2W7IR51_9PROT|nr:MmgE/PrpD family protein [Humitalea rosea]PZW48587.1 2-methylcitrate dehydratase PrpD [Humitalea rosea]